VSEQPSDAVVMSSEERQAAVFALTAEYNVLMVALTAVWNASVVRTSVFLGVLSAAAVALGLGAQAGVDPTYFLALAVLAMLVVLFLGVTTFVRLVQLQREAIVYIVGQNRIRHFFVESLPTIKPYLVLPAHDDQAALYRSIGTGMSRRPPRYPLLNMVAQTQGIVGVITGVVAASVASLAIIWAGPVVWWLAGAAAFLLTVVLLFIYWQRSLAEVQAAVRPLSSTPADEVGAPF
jgi:hypothetical protein